MQLDDRLANGVRELEYPCNLDCDTGSDQFYSDARSINRMKMFFFFFLNQASSLRTI